MWCVYRCKKHIYVVYRLYHKHRVIGNISLPERLIDAVRCLYADFLGSAPLVLRVTIMSGTLATSKFSNAILLVENFLLILALNFGISYIAIASASTQNEKCFHVAK